MPVLQASNSLVDKLEGTCREQLEALNKMRQHMTSAQHANMQRHDAQKHQLEHMVFACIVAIAGLKSLMLLSLSACASEMQSIACPANERFCTPLPRPLFSVVLALLDVVLSRKQQRAVHLPLIAHALMLGPLMQNLIRSW